MAKRMAGDKPRLYWFEGRNTPAVADNVEEARRKGVAGSKGKVVASRMPNESEQAKIRSGTWIRARPPGTAQNSSAGPNKTRPALARKAKGNPVT